MAARGAWNPRLEGFECRACGACVDRDDPAPVCPICGRPLLARYDLEALRREHSRDTMPAARRDLWRWAAVLPIALEFETPRLGEGGTPLLPMPRLARAVGVRALHLKAEAGNPTHSFKARGLALAVAGALAHGRHAIALPSAGNAGSAAAAYAAAAGFRCRIAIPEDTPEGFVLEQRALGAEVALVPGTISDAGRHLAHWAPVPEWWNVATFKEPFRVEGKKTLGWEIAEQTAWDLPDAILYPTGGGTGLIGMWRAFGEMKTLGWIDRMPRLHAVQVSGCAPIVHAWREGAARARPWEDARTVASGLRVPAPFADDLILAAVHETGGSAVAVAEEAMLDGMNELAAEGVLAGPEGAATLAALRALRGNGTIATHDRVVIYDTGSGLKYPEAWRAAVARRGIVAGDRRP